MSELETTRQELLKVERHLARLRGEKGVVETQLTKTREQLAGLGVAESEVPTYLAKLSAEAVEIKSKIAKIEEELSTKMSI